MNRRRIATILLMAVLIAAMLWIGINRGKTGGNAGNTAEEGTQGNGQETPNVAGEIQKTDAELRVDREGKILEGWAEPPCIVLDPGHGGG